MLLTCTNIKVSQLKLYHVCNAVTRLTNASMASCDDKVVTARNLDSTSCTKIECIYVYQLSVSISNPIYYYYTCYRVSYCNAKCGVAVVDVGDKSSVVSSASRSSPPRRRTPPG